MRMIPHLAVRAGAGGCASASTSSLLLARKDFRGMLEIQPARG
jgi:hypothetical protein